MSRVIASTDDCFHIGWRCPLLGLFLMKLRSFFTIVVAVVTTLLLVGVSGLYWLTAHNPLATARAAQRLEPEAAIFVPRQAPLMASLRVDLDQLKDFRVAAAAPGRRRLVRAELDQLEASVLANTGLTYSADIQPWIGDEITFAVTTSDIDRTLENGSQPGYLLIVSTDDPERSREFLQLFWQKRAVAGENLVFEQYSGVKLIYATPPQAQRLGSTAQLTGAAAEVLAAEMAAQSLTPTIASALVGDRFILFANHPKVLRDAITNVQAPGLNLVSSDVYQDTLQALPTSGIGLAVVNLPELSAWLGSSDSIPTSTADSDWVYHSLVMAFQLERDGVVGETALLTAPGKTILAERPTRSRLSEILRFMPATSPMVASSTNLQQLWSQIVTGLPDTHPLATLTHVLQTTLQSRWGLDVPHDVFEWVTGDYGLAFVPRLDLATSDWIFVAETSPDATQGIEQLDAIARQQGLNIGPIRLGDQQVSAWTDLSAQATTARKPRSQDDLVLSADVQGVHAQVGRYELFATSVAAINQVLTTSEQSMASSSAFQRAIAPFDDANDGYLYLDWPALRAPIAQHLPLTGLIEGLGKPFFDHWRSLTITSYGSTPTMRRGAVFLRLHD